MAFDAQAHVIPIVLDHLHVHEVGAEALNHTKEGTLDEDLLCQLIWCVSPGQHFVCHLLLVLVAVNFLIKAQDGLDYDSRDLSGCENLRSLLGREQGLLDHLLQGFVVEIVSVEDALLDVLYLLRKRLLGFDFDHVASSKLIFDVLGGTETLEDSSLHHDAHLGGESFSFFHRVSCQDDGASLVASDLADNLPHEAARLGVHAR